MQRTNQRELSIIIPALSEVENLLELLPAIHSTLQVLEINYEILVVDEYADEMTITIVNQLDATLLKPTSKGYGHALANGFQAAGGDFIITMDADQSHPASFLIDMWESRNSADVIIASRYVKGGAAVMSRSRYLFSRILNYVASRTLGLNIRDMSSGFRLYARRVIRRVELECQNFDVLQELLVYVFAEGYRIIEIPFTYQPRGHGKSHARMIRFGVDYVKTFSRLWKLRNSIASADYDSRAYDTWLLTQRYWQRQRFKHVTELIKGQGVCLDIGCGSSRIITALPDGSIALDILIRKLRYAMRFERTLLNASAFDLPIEDASVPCVLCSQLIEHLPRGNVLDELDRVLQPGGRLVLGTPDYGNWQWRLIEWFYGKLLPQAYADEHITHYTYEELIEEFQHKRGYDLIEERYILRGELIMAFQKANSC
jgi:dolichol-phosphate mannosyltransferase